MKMNPLKCLFIKLQNPVVKGMMLINTGFLKWMVPEFSVPSPED
jgi:hypothetical protein